MIPGKINTHLFQDLTVLAKANQKGSVVYISKDNKIHSTHEKVENQRKIIDWAIRRGERIEFIKEITA